jgi:hypothetical protein
VKAVLLAAVLLVSGCTAAPEAAHDHTASSEHAHAATSQPPTTITGKPAQVMSVEQLAAALGCQATVTVNGADYRQATCTAAGADLVLLDFATAQGQRDWLEYSEMYGGVYLVGDRWALSGKSKDYMRGLQATLGGTFEDPGD